MGDGNYRSCDQKWSHDPSIADSRTQHGYDFGIGSHPTRKKNDCKQGKKGPKQSIDPGNEIEVIIKDDFFCCHRILQKLIYFLKKVNSDGDHRDHQDGENKSTQVLLYDVYV
jgi:hypothetical protein